MNEDAPAKADILTIKELTELLAEGSRRTLVGSKLRDIDPMIRQTTAHGAKTPVSSILLGETDEQTNTETER